LAARNALYSLRKEFGSQIRAQAGIYAASVALRRRSINLTREHSIDKKQPVVFAVSNLLEMDTPDAEAAQTAACNPVLAGA
jgi:hypothetical protein